MKFLILFFLNVTFILCELKAQQTVKHVAPPNWYIGFKNTKLEIIVNASQINLFTFTLKPYNGVSLLKQVFAKNSDICYLTLQIDKNTKPGFIEFNAKPIAKKSKKTLSFSYELKARSNVNAPAITSKDAMYLVLPDRFSNGDPFNDNAAGIKNKEPMNRKVLKGRHGGDIKGIINHLDYIAELGFTTLWLNPVQTNDQITESFHGYAITDHYEIDPRFGGMPSYLELCSKMQQKKLKMIMDIVPNHVGINHWLYENRDTGWFYEFDSFYRTNYRAYSILDPNAAPSEKQRAVTGWFDKTMPDLNQKNNHIATYLNQVYLWWIEVANLSGYRIDTYTYPDLDYMNGLNQLLLSEYPNLFLFGETWVNGSATQSFFVKNNIKGCEKNTLPSVTDFQMYFAIQEAVTKDMNWTEGLNRIYLTHAEDYLYKNPELLVTFLDNHDLSRIYSVVNKDYDKWAMAIKLLMTVRGIPCLYYGTEVLMEGYTWPSDAFVRKDFMGGWENDSTNLFEKKNRSPLCNKAYNLVKNCIQLRKTHLALSSGKTLNYAGQNGVYAFVKYDNKGAYLVISNSGKQDFLVNPLVYSDVINEQSNLIDIEADLEAGEVKETSFSVMKNTRKSCKSTFTLKANTTKIFYIEKSLEIK